MNFIKVNMWGVELGRLSCGPRSRGCVFTFNPDLKDTRPDVSPILLPKKYWQNFQMAYSDDRKIYQGLPPFIADSLPDAWGNRLFETWVKKNKLTQRTVTPLYKLMFIGKRGMGALEFEPCDDDLQHTLPVDIKSLHELSLKIQNEREDIKVNSNEELTLNTLLSVGTSAGGRQMKAIIAINRETGEIRSGQVDNLDGFDYYILKFQNAELPTSEIEFIFYLLAKACGITMEECKLMNVGGINHFLTRRFDRKDGKKLHMQTLAAMSPDATSYEDLFDICRQLELTDKEIQELYRRLVFNVMANNTDDHNKNFSFLLEENGRWQLSPAYDMTFIFNRYGTNGEKERCLSIAGKLWDITKDDLIELGRENGIRNPKAIIDKTADELKKIRSLIDKYGIDPRWGSIIVDTITQRLSDFGYIEVPQIEDELVDSKGRIFTDIQINVNTKGHYEVSVKIDGMKRRRFVRPNMELYPEFQQNNFVNGSQKERIELLEHLFPIE